MKCELLVVVVIATLLITLSLTYVYYPCQLSGFQCFIVQVTEMASGQEVAEAVRNKKIKYGKWKKENTEEARMEYKKSRQNAKRVISSAKEKKQKEWTNDLNDSECQNEIF